MNKDTLRAKLGAEYGLPEDLSELLDGDTEQEMENHARKLQRYAPPGRDPDIPLYGGLDGKGIGELESDDPRALARLSPRNPQAHSSVDKRASWW